MPGEEKFYCELHILVVPVTFSSVMMAPYEPKRVGDSVV